MVASERVMKWAVRFYPPLFFQRIWVLKIDNGFRGISVKVSKSIFNKNYNDSIFGGTIFSAADPFYPLLFHQVLSHKGYNTIVWLKSSSIQFLKPSTTDLYFKIDLTEEDIAKCEQQINTIGKFLKSCPIEIFDKNGELCVKVINEVYVRMVI